MANKPRFAAKPPEVEGNPVHNEVLLGLPSPECDAVFSQLTFVQLRNKDVLQESEQPIKYAYFMDSGLASVLNVTPYGKSVEVGLFGKEGCSGLPVAIGLTSSSSQIVIQVSGAAFRITVPNLIKVLRDCSLLERRMQQYGQIMTMQAAQVATCNRLHEVEERLARWLLMSQDRLGGDIVPLTHEFLAHMLGTRRSSVTVAAGLLHKAGLITYNRGQVKIEDRDRLEDAACECYAMLSRYTATWKKEAI